MLRLSRKPRLICALLAIVCASTASLRAQTPPKDDDVTTLLHDGGSDQVQRALSAMHGMPARPAIDGLRGGWMARLLELERYHDVAELCEHLVLRAPYYTNDLGFLLSARVRALLAEGETYA